MKRSVDMQRLSDEIVAAYDLRIAQLAHLRQQTHAEIAHAARTRRAMAAQQRTELTAYATALHTDTRQQLDALQAARAARAARLRDDLRGYVIELRTASTAQVQEYRQQRETMAAAQREQLTHQQQQLVAEVQAMRGDFQDEHRRQWQRWHVANSVPDSGAADVYADATGMAGTVENFIQDADEFVRTTRSLR